MLICRAGRGYLYRNILLSLAKFSTRKREREPGKELLLIIPVVSLHCE